MQAALNNAVYKNASINRKDQVKMFRSLLHDNTVSQTVDATVDPNSMFSKMTTVAAREYNIEEFFHYELIQEPMSLFKNGMIRKSDKPSIRKVIMPEEDSIKKDDIRNCDIYVLDGGALLH